MNGRPLVSSRLGSTRAALLRAEVELEALRRLESTVRQMEGDGDWLGLLRERLFAVELVRAVFHAPSFIEDVPVGDVL